MAESHGSGNWTMDDWQQRWGTWRDAGTEHKKKIPRNQPLIAQQMQALAQTTGKYTDIKFIGKPLGKGAYGTVWKVTAKRHFTYPGTSTLGDEDVTMACKVIRLVKQKNMEFVETVRALLLSDVMILQNIEHRHIATVDHYIPIADTVTGFPFSSMLVFMELCDGDLETIISKRPGRKIPAHDCRIWFMQMAFALEYLHKARVVHLDIKPANILFKFADDSYQMSHLWDSRVQTRAMHSVVYKLSDFGLAIRYGANDHMSDDRPHGTPRFMAPEMRALMRMRPGQRPRIRTVPCDVYSLGMTLAFAYFGQSKYNSVWDKVYDYMLKPLVVDDAPRMAQLLRWMASPIPDLRPEISQIIQHHWLWVRD